MSKDNNSDNDIIDLDDENKVDELFKNVKLNVKMQEYDEFGLKKGTGDPEVLKFATTEEFDEEHDIFIPAPKNNLPLYNYDNDMDEKDMNDEFKELEKELKGDNSGDNDFDDNFIMIANEGIAPVEFNFDKKDNKAKEEEIISKDTQKKEPSYKYITKEEVESIKEKFFGDKNYDFAKKNIDKYNDKGLTKYMEDEDEFEEYEYDDEEEIISKEVNINTNTQKEPKQKTKDEIKKEEQEKIKNAIIGGRQNIKVEFISKNKDKPNNDDNFIEENFDDIELDHDGIIEKNGKVKLEQNKNNIKKTKTKQLKKLKENGELSDDSFNIEELEKITQEEDIKKKTEELYNNRLEEDNGNLDELLDQQYYKTKKIKTDITQVNDKTKHQPMVIKTVNKKKEEIKNVTNEDNKEEKEEKEENSKEEETNNKNKEKRRKNGETKEEKKLRKNLVKMENRERRAEKKKTKEAFKEEKLSQQKSIAISNKVIRYGVSVKDL